MTFDLTLIYATWALYLGLSLPADEYTSGRLPSLGKSMGVTQG